MMNRRDVLKTAGLVLGYTLTAGTAAAVLGGCSADATPGWSPSFLTADQAKVINGMAEVIIPGTDKMPGAKDVNIAKFIDETYMYYKTPEQQQSLNDDFKAFAEEHDFGAMKDGEKMAFIKSELEKGSKFVKTVYEQSVTGFCTSEKGSKEVLVFDPIPGSQKGCIPLEEVGGIWAI